MEKYIFNDFPDKTTPFSANVFNEIQDNIETEINNSGVVVSATEPQGESRKKVWIQKGKNLFNKDNVTYGTLNEDGSITYTESYYTTDFIKVNPNTEYYKTRTDSARTKFFNKNKEPLTNSYTDIENGDSSTAFISPSNAYYLRVSLKIAYIDTLQIEQNATATSYEEYIEPKIYVLNNNGVYEEFSKKEEDTGWKNIELRNATSFSWAPAKYRKIGKVVYVQGGITLTKNDANTEYFDLPYPPIAGIPVPMLVNSSSFLISFYITSGGTLKTFGYSSTTSKEFYFNFSYIAKE